jgi:hypothetical protein
MNTTISRSLFALSLCLLPLAAGAAPAPGMTAEPDVVAHLGRSEGENGRTHVHVQLKRSDITDVTVELFDADGVVLHTYALKPRQGDVYRPVLAVDVAPSLAARVDTARVTAFTISSARQESLFDSGRIKKSENCFENCLPTRWECNTYCWCKGCTSTTYSCNDVNGLCIADCTCGGCIGEPVC